jgi:hypothetical protein
MQVTCAVQQLQGQLCVRMCLVPPDHPRYQYQRNFWVMDACSKPRGMCGLLVMFGCLALEVRYNNLRSMLC